MGEVVFVKFTQNPEAAQSVMAPATVMSPAKTRPPLSEAFRKHTRERDNLLENPV
jgi:hypothetical protein